MRNYSRTIILIGLIVFTFGPLAGISLMFPTGTSAHPALGFTPTPVPTRDKDAGETLPSIPPDYVLVGLEQCDLICLEQFSQAGNTASALATTPEIHVQVPVRVVHQGSGFIVDQMLSDIGSTRIQVPYPGQWQVFIIGPPQLVSNLATAIDTTPLNLANFSASLAAGPIPVAMVDANTDTTQMISCPVLCLIEPTPTPEIPPFLPETGQENSPPPFKTGQYNPMSTIWLIIGAGLLLTGMLIMGLLALVMLRREGNR